MAKNSKHNRHVLLKGEGPHQHVLHGEFTIDETIEFSSIVVTKDGLLKHETPSGAFAEHNTLLVDTGNWVMGKQVEYNPFDETISRIWD
jgi:hypothetical protein